MKFGKFW
ncbi:hypothetical protein pdam_00000212 [Pocillopora damicornis]|nr:hypothetical protein pdam_00000212 [Pocillopora damicornis]